MKVAWVSHTASLGAGAEMVLEEAIRGLQQAGVQQHVIAPEYGELTEHLNNLGIPVSVVPFGWWISKEFQPNLRYGIQLACKNTLPALKPLKQLLKEVKPDLVVSNTIASSAGAIAARLTGIPHIWYIHELLGSEGHNLFFDLGTNFSLTLMDKLSRLLIVNSQTTFHHFEKSLPTAKLRTVYCAVDTPPAPATSETSNSTETLRLVIVSRIAPGKRQEDAVRAVAALVHQGLSVDLTLVGREDEAYANSLRQMIDELNIASHVHFAGYTPNPFAYLAEADIALTCSRGETFGRVAVEAMKWGKPIIGAASGGTSEIIKDGWNGLLYPLGDTGALAERIGQFYRNRKLLSEMGSQAYSWSHETFNLDKYSVDLLRVFQEAVGTRPVSHT